MRLEHVQKCFGKSCYAFSKNTGMSPASYGYWRKLGYIPILTQIKLQKMCDGKIKANLHHIDWDSPHDSTDFGKAGIVRKPRKAKAVHPVQDVQTENIQTTAQLELCINP